MKQPYDEREREIKESFYITQKESFIIELTKGELRVMGSRDGSHSKVSDTNIEDKDIMRKRDKRIILYHSKRDKSPL